MAEHADREAFIPYRRADLVELCIEDGQLDPNDIQQFRDFCEILSAYYHFKSHRTLEVLKDNFAPFNPDADTRTRVDLSPEQVDVMEERLARAFETVLQCANYTRLSQADLEGAFATESLIPLKTSVDFEEYERVIFYYRGDNFKTITIKRLFWRKEMVVDNLERVALLLKFKDAPYFEARKVKVEDLNFEPGKMYLYIYKNIPRFDLELLFPNVKVSMNWRDRLMFVVPAIGSAVAMVAKVLPSLVIIFAVIVILLLGTDVASRFDIESGADVDTLAALTAALSIAMTLGGFAYKQYSDYTKKRTQFLKKVTDTLFFKNLVTNQGVLYTLIDAAEEEETKEIILVYYHLLIAGQPLTAEQLDDRIETWMGQKLDAHIDFDIQKTLTNLAGMHAPVATGMDGETTDVALLRVDARGAYQAVPMNDAKAVIDYIWDNIFHYPMSSEDIIPSHTAQTSV